MVAPFADPPPLAAPCVLCHSKVLSKVLNCEGGIPPSKQAAGMSTSRSRRSTLKDGRLTCRNSNPLATCSSSTLGVGPLRFHRPVACRCHSSILHGDASSGSIAAEKGSTLLPPRQGRCPHSAALAARRCRRPACSAALSALVSVEALHSILLRRSAGECYCHLPVLSR